MQPYTSQQWQTIHALGHSVDRQLEALNVRLWMGGEPTFVSQDDYHSPQWQTEALGADKLALSIQLLQNLAPKFAGTGALLHHGMGKCYAGERFPRWALGCYWRTDGQPLWHRESLLTPSPIPDLTPDQAKHFIHALAHQLGVNATHILPASEMDSRDCRGYILPLLSIAHEDQVVWSSCRWTIPTSILTLLSGESAIGLRLPLETIPKPDVWAVEATVTELTLNTDSLSNPGIDSADNTIRTAVTVEVRDGILYVFMPPIASAGRYLALLHAIETTAQTLNQAIRLEGFPPPSHPKIKGFQITPDPGVIEVNIHPATHWDELVEINTHLYEAARSLRLGAEKFALDGRRIPTGGGAHITLGGESVDDSPLLRRPDLLRSLITYWQNHPSLSYLFADLFVGPTSQSPRVDEARHESLYELDIAFHSLTSDPLTSEPVTPEMCDRLLRHLLVDVTGNGHRAEFCIDKLFPVDNLRLQLGLLELRAFTMPPHAQLRLLQLLLIRAFVAWFWKEPYQGSFVRWGTTLHDRFLLPHYIQDDLQSVLNDLAAAGFEFDRAWFEPFFEFRFPVYGSMTLKTSDRHSLELQLRHAIEPWNVIGDAGSSGTSRPVDASMERIQVQLGCDALDAEANPRYAIVCNGYPIPVQPCGDRPGVFIGAVRFRARAHHTADVLHPAIHPHAPLVFEVIDRQTGHSLGGCTYHVNAPDGGRYEERPNNTQEATSRRVERLIPHGATKSPFEVPAIPLNPEYPLTLDLRRVRLQLPL